MGAYFTVLFAFALLGARATLASRAPWGPVWAVLAYHTAVHAVFLTTLRYRVPLEPFLCLLAAAGAAPYLLRGAGTRVRRRPRPPCELRGSGL